MRPLVPRVCTDKAPRRSTRTRRDGSPRSKRFELRAEEHEIASWTTAAAREGFLSVSDWIREGCNTRARVGVMTSSDRQDWNTPREFLDAIAPMGPIGLDPCSNAGSIVDARVSWIFDRDGDSLVKSWAGFGLVYWNPPFGRRLPWWTRKAEDEWTIDGAESIGFVPARIDTQWFDRVREYADVALWRGRVTLLGAPSPAPFPICVPYYGPRWELFADTLAPHSTAILPRRQVLTPRQEAELHALDARIRARDAAWPEAAE